MALEKQLASVMAAGDVTAGGGPPNNGGDGSSLDDDSDEEEPGDRGSPRRTGGYIQSPMLLYGRLQVGREIILSVWSLH